MNIERTEVVTKSKASTAEESACKKTKMTEDIPGLVTEMMSSNPVILEAVFSHLSPSDIKTAALVSRTWRMVVETPRFWTKLRLRVDDENLSEVMQSRIIQLMSEIQITELSQSQEVVEMFERFFSSSIPVQSATYHFQAKAAW